MLTQQIMKILLSLAVPEVEIHQDALLARNTFTHQVQEAAQPINAQSARPHLGIAPLGGTKITALDELNLDGLVIVDWDRPGTPDTIQKTFADNELRMNLANALKESLNYGSMSTSTVMKASVSAQILSRLWYELHVASVKVQFYLPKNSLPSSRDIKSWDGSVMHDEDVPLFTRFTFDYHHQRKEIIFISAKITSDQVEWRHSLPVDVLQNLAPQKYQWLYLSADGLIFFSKKDNNGMRKGNQELLSLLASGGGVLLDYPHADTYTNCSSENTFEGINAMCGRGDLEKWGLKVTARLPVNQQFSIFGYTGFAADDEIRVYMKGKDSLSNEAMRGAEIFSVNELTQVGEDYEFDLGKSSARLTDPDP